MRKILKREYTYQTRNCLWIISRLSPCPELKFAKFAKLYCNLHGYVGKINYFSQRYIVWTYLNEFESEAIGLYASQWSLLFTVFDALYESSSSGTKGAQYEGGTVGTSRDRRGPFCLNGIAGSQVW